MTDEIRSKSSTGAEKGMKPQRFDLIPVPALTKIAELYGKGAEKYAADNWRAGYEWSKSYAALQRHASQFWNGEDIDEEMGLPHMAAVAFHAMALLTFMEEHPEFDDRYTTRKKAPDLGIIPKDDAMRRLYHSARQVYPQLSDDAVCLNCGHGKTDHNIHDDNGDTFCSHSRGCRCKHYRGKDD